MRSSRAYRIVLRFSCLLAALLSAGVGAGSRVAQTEDDTALRALIARYYEAVAARDTDRAALCWSPTSPHRVSRFQELHRQAEQAGAAGIAIRDIRRIRIDGAKASLRVELGINTADRPGAPAGQAFFDFECVRGQEQWLIWREEVSQILLASRLAELRTKDERENLLHAESDLKSPSLCRALVWQGDRLDGRGETTRARELYELSLEVAREIGDRTGEAEALNGLAGISVSFGSPDQALELAQKSLALRDQVGDMASIAKGLAGLGYIHRVRDELDQALECYEKSLSIRRDLGNKAGMASVLREIGLIHYLQRDYLNALDLYTESLNLFESLGDKPESAQTLYNAGVVYRALGDFDQALDCYHRSLLIHQEARNKQGLASCHYSIANIHAARGNYAKALEHYQKQKELAGALGDRIEVAAAISGMASVYMGQGHPERALAGYQDSLAIYRSVGRKRLVASALNNIAVSRTITGDHARALEDYSRSLALYEELKDREGIARGLLNLGKVEVLSRKPDRARDSLARSLALWEELGNKEGASVTMVWTARAHFAIGSWEKAVEFAGRAVTTARTIGDPTVLWQACTVLGQGYGALGENEKAREMYEEAIQAIEGLRREVAGGEAERTAFLAGRLMPYHGMVELGVDRSQAEEALSNAERAKGRTLLDALRDGREDIDSVLSTPEREDGRRRDAAITSISGSLSFEKSRKNPDQRRVAGLEASLWKARQERDAFEVNAYAAHPELRLRRGEVPAISTAEAARLLPGTAGALLEFVVTEKRTYLFVATRVKDGEAGGAIVRVHPINLGREDLGQRVEAFRRKISDRDLGFRGSASELFDLLLGPARPELKDRDSLVIVPDGPLWDLPFQTLISGGKYLWEQHEISYAPSLGVLREMARLHSQITAGQAGPPNLLAMGNAPAGLPAGTGFRTLETGGHPSLLPEAEDQVRRIGLLYKNRAKVYVGKDASEEKFKKESGSFGIIHLATHGVLVDTNPLYSHVAMARGGREDGHLEAREILRLRLNADLVVLSACETARGRVGAGEGMIGLSWALFVAGCPAAVVSQWKVDAAATTALMVEFHRRLRAGSGISKSAALRQAALETMRDPHYRHPFYWAGFILIGDGS